MRTGHKNNSLPLRPSISWVCELLHIFYCTFCGVSHYCQLSDPCSSSACTHHWYPTLLDQVSTRCHPQPWYGTVAMILGQWTVPVLQRCSFAGILFFSGTNCRGLWFWSSWVDMDDLISLSSVLSKNADTTSSCVRYHRCLRRDKVKGITNI